MLPELESITVIDENNREKRHKLSLHRLYLNWDKYEDSFARDYLPSIEGIDKDDIENEHIFVKLRKFAFRSSDRQRVKIRYIVASPDGTIRQSCLNTDVMELPRRGILLRYSLNPPYSQDFMNLDYMTRIEDVLIQTRRDAAGEYYYFNYENSTMDEVYQKIVSQLGGSLTSVFDKLFYNEVFL